jgi:hypothetical protein
MSVICDIKTGKSQPWAGLQLAAYSLLNSFDVYFDKERHIYQSNGTVIPSVTQILLAENFIDDSWFDSWSRDKGSMVHLAIHYDITGELDEDSVVEEIWPYLLAFRKFINESGFKVDKSEIPACNLTYGYAGTPDLVGCFIKPTAARRFVLELNKEGKYKLIPHTDQQDFNVWLAAVAVHHWKKNNLRR